MTKKEMEQQLEVMKAQLAKIEAEKADALKEIETLKKETEKPTTKKPGFPAISSKGAIIKACYELDNFSQDLTVGKVLDRAIEIKRLNDKSRISRNLSSKKQAVSAKGIISLFHNLYSGLWKSTYLTVNTDGTINANAGYSYRMFYR